MNDSLAELTMIDLSTSLPSAGFLPSCMGALSLMLIQFSRNTQIPCDKTRGDARVENKEASFMLYVYSKVHTTQSRYSYTVPIYEL